MAMAGRPIAYPAGGAITQEFGLAIFKVEVCGAVQSSEFNSEHKQKFCLCSDLAGYQATAPLFLDRDGLS